MKVIEIHGSLFTFCTFHIANFYMYLISHTVLMNYLYPYIAQLFFPNNVNILYFWLCSFKSRKHFFKRHYSTIILFSEF